MRNDQRNIDREYMARNCKEIGEQGRKALEEAAKAFDDFRKACAKIDLEKFNDHRHHN